MSTAVIAAGLRGLLDLIGQWEDAVVESIEGPATRVALGGARGTCRRRVRHCSVETLVDEAHRSFVPQAYALWFDASKRLKA